MTKNTKILLVSLVLILSSISVAEAAPTYRLERTIYPETTNTYELGTSTKKWLNITGGTGYFSNLTVSGTCTGCGSGTISTSTSLSSGQVDFSTGVATIGNDSNFVWDNTNKRLGVGTSTPFSPLSVSTAAQQLGTLPLLTVASTTNATLFTVLGSGNVGIGTASPATALEVNGTAKATQLWGNVTGNGGQTTGLVTAGIYMASGDFYTGSTETKLNASGLFMRSSNQIAWSSGSTGASLLDTYLTRSATNTLKLSSDGTTGLANLVVTGDVTLGTSSNIKINASGSNPSYLRFTAAGGDAYVGNNGSAVGGMFTANGLANAMTIVATAGKAVQIGDTASANVTILANGNVGIGTTSPTNVLSVVKSLSGGDLAYFQNTHAAGYSDNLFIDNSGTWRMGIGYGNPSTSSTFANTSYIQSQGVDFQIIGGAAGATPIARFTSAGNVGIGTSTPTSRLDVVGTLGNTGLLFRVASTTATNVTSDYLNVTAAGSVGIGTTTPWGALSVMSTTDPVFVVATSSGKTIGGYDSDGHRFTSGPAPTISSCGTGTGTVLGDDQAGTITTATAATSCTLTFAKAYQNNGLYCTVTDDSLVGFADISSTSTTAVTFGISSALTGGHLFYQCAYHR